MNQDPFADARIRIEASRNKRRANDERNRQTDKLYATLRGPRMEGNATPLTPVPPSTVQ